jgi:hypothetical protein
VDDGATTEPRTPINNPAARAHVAAFHESGLRPEISDRLKRHLHAFLMAYNFAKRLKTLKGLTP